jgi:alpha-glucosidase (family GH31 glycosyl hydrolase)
MTALKKLLLSIILYLLGSIFPHSANAQSSEVIVGSMRLQALSKNLIRIEQRGPHGFENRNTFTVVNRNWPGEPINRQEQDSQTVLITSQCRIVLPKNGHSLEGIQIQLKSEKNNFRFKGIPPRDFIPGPVSNDQLWILADSPRLVPPEWGATPPPEQFKDLPASGWDTTNNAEDVYVFILERGQYERFRNDFLKLTGPTPMPPLFAFGLWNSRYHPYTEEEALQTIDTYRRKHIPLDMFVVDTDWRRGASHGYAINELLFPDMERFIRRAHEKHVHLMYNDHPEAQTQAALDSSEFQYRWNGLTSLFKQGIDVWWYDRNWMTGLHEPMPGISKEVWGMRLYYDITKKYHPDRRPLIMSNVDGIDNGLWNIPSHPAAHRFPIWWTGDQKSRWQYLEMGIANGVNSGILRMMPYVNEDLGGHMDGNPEPDQYVRWIQYGVFSPITRLHCTRGLTRYPWDYGEEAERIASDYIRLRYRLLPTIYAAARRAYEDGTPIMRRCDLEWPDEPDAKRDKQFLFGEDLLIAPIALSKTKDIALPSTLLQTVDGEPGLRGEYFDNQNLQGTPLFVRVDSAMNFIWGTGSPDPRIPADHFSVRWTGIIHTAKENKLTNLKVTSDDGVRVWIDDSLVVDAWRDQPATDYVIAENLKPERSYSIRIEYFENAGGAQLQLLQTIDVEQVYQAWIPPGNWQDIWTGKILHGPEMIVLNPVLWKCPIYVRNGGIIFSLPQMQYITEHPWNTIIVDAFVPLEKNAGTTRILYEDDGLSPDYQKDAFCKTPVTMTKHEETLQLAIDKRQGNYNGAISSREWVIRLNLPQHSTPKNIEVNGKKLEPGSSKDITVITQTELREETMPLRGAGSKPRPSAGQVLELTIHQKDVREPVVMTCTLK